MLYKELFVMLIDFKCPNCQASLQVGSDFAGKICVCPKCREKITVPKPGTGVQSEDKETATKE
jgi:hypothetical protein